MIKKSTLDLTQLQVDLVPSTHLGSSIGTAARGFNNGYIARVITNTVQPPNSSQLYVRGIIDDGASAIGVKVGNGFTLSTAGSSIVGFYNDDGSTLRAKISHLGGLRTNVANAALPTASATYRGQTMFIEAASGSPDQLYFCAKTASDTYEWVAASPPEPWHVVGSGSEPAYANSWVSYDGGSTYDVAKFRKSADGRVHLRGVVKSGTIDVTGAAEIFTLPSGYRPAKRLLLIISSNGTHGRIQINTDGKVVATHGNNTYVALDGISFYTD